MARIYWNLEQGTAEWFSVRSGIPTASRFDQIITPKRGELSASRKRYACQLIAERMLNWQAESLETVKHIEDGKSNEPLAIGQLQTVQDIVTWRVGFVATDDGRFGASPDRAAGRIPGPDVEIGGSLPVVIEVKSPTIPIQVQRIVFGHDEAYRCQVQGQLYVAEADKAIFYSHHPRTPQYLVETGRDDEFIKRMVEHLEQFSDELEEWTLLAKRAGDWQAFAAMVGPVDAAYSEE